MSNARIVYTSGQGRRCPECGRLATECSCRRSRAAIQAAQSASRGDGIVRIGRETRGRKGKGVTVISGVPLAADALDELATRLPGTIL